MIPVEVAQGHVLARVQPGPPRTIPVEAALGTIVAVPPLAVLALPPGDVSVMDGFAVCERDLVGARVQLPIVGESAAGRPWTSALAAGTAVRISTGAIVPPGADRVVAQEDTTRTGEQVDIDVAAALASARFVRAAGSDVAPGSRLLEVGTRVGATEVALLFAAGVAELVVYERPRVVVVSTGDELAEPGTVPRSGAIIGTNGAMLATLCREAGAEVLPLVTVGDDASALDSALASALRADVVVTIGGASVGDHDLVLPALQRSGCELVFHGVAARPGKPTGFAMRGDTAVFALPGNPASAFVMFELFVRPALRRRLGVRGSVVRPRIPWPTATPLPGAGRRAHYVRTRIVDGRLHALPDQASGSLRSLVDVDAIACVPAGVREVAAGDVCEAIVLSHAWHERAP